MDDAQKGLPEAHTPVDFSGEAARAAKIGSVKAATEAAMRDLAAELSGDPDDGQQSLMLDEMDEQFALFSGPVKHVARQLDIAKAGRGRPKGSQNKANAEFRDMLMRMGFRHPGLNLAALANADPLALALEWMGYDIADKPAGLVLADALVTGGIKRSELAHWMAKAQEMIGKANSELMPYFESKAPVKLDVKRSQLGVMIIGEMDARASARDDGTIDLTAVPDPREKDQ